MGARVEGVKNGAGRKVKKQRNIKGIIRSLVDDAITEKQTKRALFVIASGHENERQTIVNVVEHVQRKQRNCLLVLRDADKLLKEKTTYATEGAIVGGVVGGVAVGAACVGGACPPLAPVCCLVVGGVAVGGVVGSRFAKTTVIIISGDEHNIIVEATPQTTF